MTRPVEFPFFMGINNRVAVSRLPKGYLADAANVDITGDRRIKTRRGKEVLAVVANGHSLAAVENRLFVAIADSLRVITNPVPFSTAVVRTGLATGRIAYAGFGGLVWWSNGTDSGRCAADNADRPWSFPKPLPPVLSNVVGGLPAGTYRVSITHADDLGEESPASIPVEVEIAASSAIVVTLPPAPAHATKTNVFHASADGPLQLGQTVAAGTSAVTISGESSGRALGAAYALDVLPAGTLLALHNGRLLSAAGPMLYVSEPYRFGVYNPLEGYIPFPAPITVVATVKGGVFIVADRVYWLAGTDVTKAEVEPKADGAAVFGTQFELAETKTVGWLGEFGVTLGAADGTVSMPTHETFAPPSAASGYAMVVRDDGDLRVLFSLDDTAVYGARAAGDFRERLADFQPGADGLSVLLDKDGAGVSRYTNFLTHGMAEQGGNYYLVDGDSFCQLAGEMDKTVPVAAFAALGKLAADSPQRKSLVSAYADLRCAAPVELTVRSGAGTYLYPSRGYGNAITTRRFDTGRGIRETWFDVALVFAGQPVEVSSVVLYVHDSPRRIG